MSTENVSISRKLPKASEARVHIPSDERNAAEMAALLERIRCERVAHDQCGEPYLPEGAW